MALQRCRAHMTGPSSACRAGAAMPLCCASSTSRPRYSVSDGFYLPEAKGGTDWLDRNTLLLSSAYGKDMATRSGYSRTVRLWRRGSDVDQAPVLIETTPESMVLWASVDRTRETETVWFADKPGFFDTILWLGDRNGPKVKLDLPTDTSVESHRDWLVVKRRTEWTVGGKTYAPDTLLGISLPAFLAGARDFTVLFEPGERRALQSFFWSNGLLILSILDELKPVFRGSDAITSWVVAVEAFGAARDRRGQRVALRHAGIGEQRRSPRQCTGSDHASHLVADRAWQVSRRVEAGAAHIHRRRACRDTARGGRARW